MLVRRYQYILEKMVEVDGESVIQDLESFPSQMQSSESVCREIEVDMTPSREA